jgi:hypothetical protein
MFTARYAGRGSGESWPCRKARGHALSRGVTIVRLQAHPIVSDFWHDRLSVLVTGFRQHFELRVLRHLAQLHSVNLCANDVGDVIETRD